MSGVDPLIYLNVELTDGSDGGLPSADPAGSLAYRDVARSGAIVEKASDYYVGVSRAVVPLTAIPLLVGEPDPAGTNGLDLVDRITITYSGRTNTVPVRMLKQPENVSTVYPQRDLYWGVWGREELAAMLTDALRRASTGLIDPPPYVTFDPATQLNTLYLHPLQEFDLTGTDSSEGVSRSTKAMIWVNYSCSLMWLGFDIVLPRPSFASDPAQTADMWGYLNIKNNGANYILADGSRGPNPAGGVTPAGGENPLLYVTQGYPNTGIIGLQFIQIRSSLPSAAEFTDTATGSSKEQVALLTDLRPDSTQVPASYQSTLSYALSGTAQIRWIKLTGDAPITSFILSLWWVDRFNKYRPLYTLNQSCSVKLAFARRSIVDHWAFSYDEQEETIFNTPRAAAVSGGVLPLGRPRLRPR